jgi:hypothetical protein
MDVNILSDLDAVTASERGSFPVAAGGASERPGSRSTPSALEAHNRASRITRLA